MRAEGRLSPVQNAFRGLPNSIRANPRQILLLPSFLCLDVAWVALGWAFCLADDLSRPGEGPPSWDFAGLFLAVWGIYLGDRLLDAIRSGQTVDLAPRHDWARSHRPLLAVLLVFVAAVFVLVVLPRLDWAMVTSGMIVALATALYFLGFRFSRRLFQGTNRLPTKELAIGVTFTAGIVIAASGGKPGMIPLVLLAGMILLFSGNCLLIARVEAVWDRTADPASYFARGTPLARLPEWLSGIALLLGGVASLGGSRLGGGSLILCAGATLVLALSPVRRHVQPIADGILLLPWLLFCLSR